MKTEPNLKRLKPHPLGQIFPPCSDDDYKLLVQSIKERGLEEPITLHEGMILDGNNRYTACKKARVEPKFTEFRNGDPISFVISKNLARRHLTTSQSAALGAELAEKMAIQEKEQKSAERAARKAAKNAGLPVEKIKSKGKRAARAAKLLNISPRSVERAAELKKEDPEEFEQVKAGTKRLGKAYKETEKKKSAAEKQSEAFSQAKGIIAGISGDIFTMEAEKKLTAKDFIKLSGLDSGEIKRIEPLISAGWSVKAALGYQSTQLTLAHPMRNFIDRAISQGGQFSWECTAYDKSFKVHVEQQ